MSPWHVRMISRCLLTGKVSYLERQVALDNSTVLVDDIEELDEKVKWMMSRGDVNGDSGEQSYDMHTAH